MSVVGRQGDSLRIAGSSLQMGSWGSSPMWSFGETSNVPFGGSASSATSPHHVEYLLVLDVVPGNAEGLADLKEISWTVLSLKKKDSPLAVQRKVVVSSGDFEDIDNEDVEYVQNSESAIKALDAFIREHFLERKARFAVLTDDAGALENSLLVHAQDCGLTLPYGVGSAFDLRNEVRLCYPHVPSCMSVNQMLTYLDMVPMLEAFPLDDSLNKCMLMSHIAQRCVRAGHVFTEPMQIDSPCIEKATDEWSVSSFSKDVSASVEGGEANDSAASDALGDRSCVCAVNGFPSTATEDDIHVFFEGLCICDDGILLCPDSPTDDLHVGSPKPVPMGVFVRFLSPEHAVQATEFNGQCFTKHVISVARSSMDEWNENCRRMKCPERMMKLSPTRVSNGTRNVLAASSPSSPIVQGLGSAQLFHAQDDVTSSTVSSVSPMMKRTLFPPFGEVNHPKSSQSEEIPSLEIVHDSSGKDEGENRSYVLEARVHRSMSSGSSALPSLDTSRTGAAPASPQASPLSAPMSADFAQTMSSLSLGADSARYVVKLRGLPYSAKVSDIQSFFHGISLKADDVYICMRNGQATGEGFIVVYSDEDNTEALKRDRQTMGRRYIELFSSTMIELTRYLSISGDRRLRSVSRGFSSSGMQLTIPQANRERAQSMSAGLLYMDGQQSDSRQSKLLDLRSEDLSISERGMPATSVSPANPSMWTMSATNDALSSSAPSLNMASSSLPIPARSAGVDSPHMGSGRFSDVDWSTMPSDRAPVVPQESPQGIAVHGPGSAGPVSPIMSPVHSGGSSYGNSLPQVQMLPAAMRGRSHSNVEYNGGYSYGGSSNGGTPGNMYNGVGWKPGNDFENIYGTPTTATSQPASFMGGGQTAYDMSRPSRYEMMAAATGTVTVAVGPGGVTKKLQNFSALSQNVKLRGLPYKATDTDICRFFDGYNVTKDQVRIRYGPDGRPSGEAVVYFHTVEEANRAMQERNGKYMGNRYLELLPCK